MGDGRTSIDVVSQTYNELSRNKKAKPKYLCGGFTPKSRGIWIERNRDNTKVKMVEQKHKERDDLIQWVTDVKQLILT